jgi:hypothetical protein
LPVPVPAKNWRATATALNATTAGIVKLSGQLASDTQQYNTTIFYKKLKYIYIAQTKIDCSQMWITSNVTKLDPRVSLQGFCEQVMQFRVPKLRSILQKNKKLLI